MLLTWQLFCLLCVLPLFAFAVEDYYKLLGIGRDASDREIKKAYRSLSKKSHPDKNPGDEKAAQKFVEIASAYEALVDPELRKIYDQYGHEGVEKRKQGGGAQQQQNPFDLFSRFFGGGGHFGHQPGERRGQNMKVVVAIPLRDFYNGADHEIELEKQAICSACEGSGSKDGKTEQCARCQGHGIIIQKHQFGPGMVQQVQMACDVCGGQGTTIKHKCATCHGARVVREREKHTVTVERGAHVDSHVVFENEADESPDHVAGDLFVMLNEEHPVMGTGAKKHDQTDGTFFRRKGADLFWTEVLSLREAWMGDWTRNLTHLDGHNVQLSRKRGQVVQPGHVEVLANEGMPIYHHETGPEYGNLLVDYTVILPDQTDKAMEKDFWAMWEKWRKKIGVTLDTELGRSVRAGHDEL